MSNVNIMYFSPTGTTKKVVNGLAEILSNDKEMNIKYINFTMPDTREKSITFGKKEILIIGIPVYAGRVPNILLKYLDTIKGDDTIAIPIVVYGNRNYDDALIELKNILTSRGFIIVAAAAFIGEHSFSKILAKGRPDNKDMNKVHLFGHKLAEILHDVPSKYVEVPGQNPIRPYYQPKDKNGHSFDFKKITPKTNDNCIDCKLCAEICPVGSIDFDDVSKLNGICIKCCACVKNCPTQAKSFDDENYRKHKVELEINYSNRREPELFF